MTETHPAPPGNGGTHREDADWPAEMIVKAARMRLGEYLSLRKWKRFADEDPEEQGFFIEWVGWGPSHQKGYDNLVSWMPEEKFLRSYVEIPKRKN